MRRASSLVLALALCLVAAVAQAKEGWYPRIVDVAFVARHAVIPKPDGVMIVDSRPTARKYDPGHISTAVNIPDSQFEKLQHLLPADKSQLLIFYCDGPECMLSHNSAFKAEKLGYTNVQVYAAGYPDWVKNGHVGAVSVAYLKKLMDEGKPMVLVDSRPKERKFDKGHIPGAINIPDSQFDKLAHLLPADKSAALFFYCDGLACVLSAHSAAKAVKLGYTNVMVVPEGYPAWEQAYGPNAPAAAPRIEKGKEDGSISVASFERIYKEAPRTIALVDVRDPAEHASGTFNGATNIPVGALEKRIGELAADKPVVFFCGTAGRAGEAHDMAKLLRPELKTFFINAKISFAKDGTYALAELK
jgi:rhodanese-related sulfurtransferase